MRYIALRAMDGGTMSATITDTRTLEASRFAAIFTDHPRMEPNPRFVFDIAGGERFYVKMTASEYRAFVNQAAHAMGRHAAPWDKTDAAELVRSLLSVMDPDSRADVIATSIARWHTPRVTVEAKS